MKICLLFILPLCCLSTARATEDDPLAKEKAKLQGVWRAQMIVDNGKAEANESVKMLTLTIQGDRYIYTLGNRKFTAKYTINPGKKPKELDVTFEEGPQKGNTMRSIYSLEGDELKICGGDKRPTELASKPKSETVLFVFKREKR